MQQSKNRLFAAAKREHSLHPLPFKALTGIYGKHDRCCLNIRATPSQACRQSVANRSGAGIL